MIEARPPNGTSREFWTRNLLYPAHTLPTALAPALVAVGLAVHDRVFAPVPALLAFLAGWIIQLAGVAANNFENLRHDPEDREHPELVDAVRSGLLSLRALRTTIIVAYAVAACLGLVLAFIGGWPVIVMGVASILASWAYSAPPLAFGRQGVADPIFFLFFGVVSVLGIYYVQAVTILDAHHWREALSPVAVAVSLPIGALIAAILVIDDLRDRDFDVVKGKNTVAVRFGPFWSRLEVAVLIAFAYLAPFWLWHFLEQGAVLLLPLVTLPLAIPLTLSVWRQQSYEKLLPMTPRMAMLTVAYALCLAAGLSA